MTPAEREVVEEGSIAAYELGALLDVMVSHMNGEHNDPMAANALAGLARMAKAIANDVGKLLVDRR